LGTYSEVTFSNYDTDREILFRFTPQNPNGDVVDLAIVAIKRINTAANPLILSSYWKAKHPDTKEISSLQFFAGFDFETKATNFVSFVNSVFHSDLLDVVKGNFWIDIPLDWGPYK
jgi:hypothetical protein